jgi:quercetin dioxygenase-like cupin family protein
MAAQIIRLGQIEIRFLLDGGATGGSLSMFEFLVPAGAKVPAPHYHESFDEAIYGIEGTLTFVVGGNAHEIGPGERCFVPRGAVHHFVNHTAAPTRTLAVLTPAVVGPQYFLDLATLLPAGGGPPDPARVAEVMRRHGLIVVAAPPVAEGAAPETARGKESE